MLTGISIVKQAGTIIKSDTAVVSYEGDPIEARSAPAYVPPSEPFIPPDPMEALAPSYQFRGEGGTPFAAINPPVYVAPYIMKPPILDLLLLQDEGWWINSTTGEIVAGVSGQPPTRLPGWTFSTTKPSDVAAPSNKPTIARPYIMPLRPGELQVMPVLKGQKPAVHPIAPTVEPVEQPGPIKGTIAGFDLQKVPFWAWLAVAAFVGSRLLK